MGNYSDQAWTSNVHLNRRAVTRIFELRKEGMSERAIGLRLGLTEETVKACLENAGAETKS